MAVFDYNYEPTKYHTDYWDSAMINFIIIIFLISNLWFVMPSSLCYSSDPLNFHIKGRAKIRHLPNSLIDKEDGLRVTRNHNSMDIELDPIAIKQSSFLQRYPFDWRYDQFRIQVTYSGEQNDLNAIEEVVFIPEERFDQNIATKTVNIFIELVRKLDLFVIYMDKYDNSMKKHNYADAANYLIKAKNIIPDSPTYYARYIGSSIALFSRYLYHRHDNDCMSIDDICCLIDSGAFCQLDSTKKYDLLLLFGDAMLQASDLIKEAGAKGTYLDYIQFYMNMAIELNASNWKGYFIKSRAEIISTQYFDCMKTVESFLRRNTTIENHNTIQTSLTTYIDALQRASEFNLYSESEYAAIVRGDNIYRNAWTFIKGYLDKYDYIYCSRSDTNSRFLDRAHKISILTTN